MVVVRVTQVVAVDRSSVGFYCSSKSELLGVTAGEMWTLEASGPGCWKQVVAKAGSLGNSKYASHIAFTFYTLLCMHCTCYPLVLYELLVSFWFSASLMLWKTHANIRMLSGSRRESLDYKKWALIIRSDKEQDSEPRKKPKSKGEVELGFGKLMTTQGLLG